MQNNYCIIVVVRQQLVTKDTDRKFHLLEDVCIMESLFMKSVGENVYFIN